MTRTFQMLGILFLLISIQSCSGQSGKKQGEELKTKVDAVMDAYHKPTSKSGLYAEAKIDGEKWAADWMFVDPDPDRTVEVNAHRGDKEVIVFDFGKKIAKEKGTKTFSKITTAQMFDKNGNVLMSTDGECQVTNVTDEWIEGNFHFTFKDDASGTTHQVTDGLFRVAMPKKWKNS